MDNTGAQLGVMDTSAALSLAQERNLDLVEVSPNTDPPVCRILDYGKLRYIHSKKVKSSRKAPKSTTMREVRLRPNIGQHDLQSKIRKVKQLLDDGAKVRLSVMFRGREITHPELGMSLLKKVASTVVDSARLEKPPAMEGRFLAINLVPSAAKVEKKDAEVVADAQT